MLNKFFLISLGGSGEKLARYLKQDLDQRLYNSGWEQGMPAAFRWLCFDVARTSDVIVKDVPASLGEGNGTRVGLADDELRYVHYLRQVSTNHKGLPALVGALPSPSVELPPPVKGAGQRPQVGNVVGLASLRQMRLAIEQQMVRLNGDGVVDELEAVSRCLRDSSGAEPPGTTVFIASSLGGGSGAGLLQLVVELVLNTVGNDPEVEVATVLFTPDIFYDLTDTEKQGVQANCLYTLSTLINGYHSSGVVSPELAALLSAGGVELSSRRRAAVTNFFIGRGNGEFDFLHQNVAIKATAKAIGRMLLDEEMVKSLEAHLKTNGEGAAVTSDFRIVPPSSLDLSRAASSFGYASLSLGEAQLAQYASERLAKIQLEAFLHGHKRRHSHGESDDATVRRVAGEQRVAFLARARLRKEDLLKSFYEHDRVRDEFSSREKELVRGIRDLEPRDSKRWLNHIERSFQAYEDERTEQRGAQLACKADNWAQDAQTAIVEATIESIGRYGTRVTLELLDAAISHVPQVVSEVRGDRNERLEQEAKGYAKRSRSLLEAVPMDQVPNDHKSLAKAVKFRGIAAFLAEESAYFQAVAEFVDDMQEKVIAPLRACVAEAEFQVLEEESSRFAELVSSWSSGGVPPRLEPAPNQVLLEPIQEFPSLFEGLLQETMGEEDAEAEAAAAAELLTGSWRRDKGADRLIVRERKWQRGSGTPARFRLQLDVPDLKERADRWIRERQGALADRLKLSIADWIAQAPGRAQDFTEGFEKALRRADPLSEIHSGVHLRVHGRPRKGPKLHVSTIPLSPDSGAYESVANSLRGKVAAGDLPSLFDGTSSARMIEISSFFAQQVEPVVLTNLFEPIGEDWKTRIDDSMRQQFSAFRRTRALSLFVPLSPADQVRFASGWIVAELLGQLSEFAGSWDRAPLTVSSPAGRLSFPVHLLGGDVTEGGEVLARVLESLPLALVRCAAEQYEELDAYMRILDLGELDELQQWLVAGDSHESAAERCRRVREEVERRLGEARAYRRDHPIDQRNVTELGRRWEIAALTVEALERIMAALDESDEGSPEPVLLTT